MVTEALMVTAGVGLVQYGLLAGIFLRLGETGTRLDHQEDRIAAKETKVERTRQWVRGVQR